MTSRGAEKMKQDTIGVDISKDTLDVHRMAGGANRRFTNDKTGHRALIAWIGGDVARVVFEPTGPYHRAFERALAKAGLPLVKVNPRRARRFAEATGKLAKTDRLDAALLAKMGALLELEARPEHGEILAELKELHIAREALVKDRTAAKNRAKIRTLALLKRQNAQRLDQIERQIAAIDAAILAFIEADTALAKRLAILMSIPRTSNGFLLPLRAKSAGVMCSPGISRITAVALLIEMPELGTLEARQAASLAGLAPVARQSGR
jgi:transposase